MTRIKICRMRWARHVQRMEEERGSRMDLKGKPRDRRLRGRTREREMGRGPGV